MKEKNKLGQFYTTNSKYITTGLLNILKDNPIVDPFAGTGELSSLVNNLEMYDIKPKASNIKTRDSLINPIDYKGKFVLTNPPYLARNKSTDKTIYDLYSVDDLYKASLFSIIGCKGGVIILPINFLSSLDDSTRVKFLSKYKILKVNVFEETVFEDTSYTICAFSFIKKDNIEQEIEFRFFPNKETRLFNIKKCEGYRIGYELFNLKKSSVKIGRLLIGQIPSTKMFLNAIDTGTEKGQIKLSIRNEAYYGKQTDRAFATISSDRNFSIKEQELIVYEFNKLLRKNRDKYKSLFLTNYRNSTSFSSRKRIGFKLTYEFIKFIVWKHLTKV